MPPRSIVRPTPARNAGEQNSVRKRTPKARCHAQKIKCNGSRPCDQCSRRRQTCQFSDLRERFTATSDYEFGEQDHNQFRQNNPERLNRLPDIPLRQETTTSVDIDHGLQQQEHPSRTQRATVRDLPSTQPPTRAESRAPSETPLTNPLIGNSMSYIFTPHGKPLFMGTSSNWSFGKRVLMMTHEQVMGTPLSTDHLHFPDLSYDLLWDGTRPKSPQVDFDPTTLPSFDFAQHLISAVKFRCGQLFYLFDEDIFMRRFSQYHANVATESQQADLWYIHYLLILAFGKAFLIQSSKAQRPAGTDLFVQAMKLLPDLTFYDADPMEKVQVICCAALYLQCLDHRVSAYRIIGDALSIALVHGMHTGMHNLGIDHDTVQKYSKVWWTVFILERWITSIIGLPPRIRDEAINAPLPVYPRDSQLLHITDIQVKLSRILAQILNTVYGAEGRLDKQFLQTTKAALKRIADITDQLNDSFGILRSDAVTGISRISAHLHLLHHQCIVLTTRPLLYSFLQSRLGRSEQTLLRLLRSSGIRVLLQMCIDSAQKMLNIINTLLNHGILENFLPFDLEATFTACIALLMVSAIDHSLLQDPTPWSQRAFGILDEMAFSGNKVAKKMKLELELLERMLRRLMPVTSDQPLLPSADGVASGAGPDQLRSLSLSAAASQQGPLSEPVENNLNGEELNWLEDFTTAHLMEIANAVDIDSLDWIATTDFEFLE